MKQLKDYIASHYEGPLLSGPLLVVCRFYMPIAKSVSKAKKSYMDGLPHWQKPDGDNLEKFLFDCCTRTIWHDDSQVCWIARSKQWVNAEQGYTELFVTEVAEAQINIDEALKTIWTQTR